MVLEVDLYNLVGQPEHDCVSCPHPLLDIDDLLSGSGRLIGWSLLIVFFLFVLSTLSSLSLLTAFQIRSEMLEKSNLLVQLFRVVFEGVTLAHVLLVTGTTFEVVEVMTSRI